MVALFGALAQFQWQVDGFRARDLQPLVAQHIGHPYTMAQMAYDLRRLGRKQLIERIPRTHAYRFTRAGLKLIVLCTKLHGRIFCRSLALLDDAQVPTPLNRPWRELLHRLDELVEDARVAA
ncbi:hypothetical protein B1B_17072 [mine drainage metagenome]|uniref:Uncharacterized protein n=1 Tax=mine drainage metagenome TaxID=410659 RepID=T0YNV2_9ZZZZ